MKIANYINNIPVNKDIIKTNDVSSENKKNDAISLRHKSLNITKTSSDSSESIADQINNLKGKLNHIKHNINPDFSEYLLLDKIQASDKLQKLKENILIDLNKEVNQASIVNSKTLEMLNHVNKEIVNAQ